MVRDELEAASYGVGEHRNVALVERTDLRGTLSLGQALIARHATDAGRLAGPYAGRKYAATRQGDNYEIRRPAHGHTSESDGVKAGKYNTL